MRIHLPYKQLVKYSFWFSIAVGISALISFSTTDREWLTSLYRSLSIFIHFFIISYCNIVLIRFYDKWDCTNSKFNNQIKQFLVGYIMTIFLVTGFFAINFFLIKMNIVSLMTFDERFERIKDNGQLIIFIPYISLSLYSVVYFFHNFLLLNQIKTKKEIEVSELKNLHSETRNQLLQQQIQPHFLFNALNTLKSLIKKHPDQAEEYVIHLSEFLRASITDNRHQTAKLNDELKICADYMNMQKIRFGDALNYIVDIDPKDDRLQRHIPNFSLQPLLENAIKHNQFTLSKPLDVVVFLQEDKICIKNPIRLRKIVEHSTGNGLYNLQQRCRIIYNEDLTIKNDGQVFEVQLKLI